MVRGASGRASGRRAGPGAPPSPRRRVGDPLALPPGAGGGPDPRTRAPPDLRGWGVQAARLPRAPGAAPPWPRARSRASLPSEPGSPVRGAMVPIPRNPSGSAAAPPPTLEGRARPALRADLGGAGCRAHRPPRPGRTCRCSGRPNRARLSLGTGASIPHSSPFSSSFSFLFSPLGKGGPPWGKFEMMGRGMRTQVVPNIPCLPPPVPCAFRGGGSGRPGSPYSVQSKMEKSLEN